MSDIDNRFAQLKKAGRKAFIPFITAGDPNIGMTARLLQRLDQAGSAIGEVGIPYSDPIADGPVIQASYTRALKSGIKLDGIFNCIRQVKPALGMPLVTMVSYAIVHRRGIERFVDDAANSGFAGAIVPDLLVEESESVRRACAARDFALIQLVTPTTSRQRMLRIAESSTGFIYFVSVTGITGERNALPADLVDQVSWLRERTPVPICIGFGISTREQARLLAPVADGLIVGSALVRRYSDATGEESALSQVDSLARELISALG